MQEFQERFYQDAYCTEYISTVKECRKTETGYAILLEDTIFYPEGGGQPADTGTLNGIKVEDVQRENGVVVQYTKQPLKQGETVNQWIDWTHRFDLMQAHSGEHMFSGIVHKMYGYDNVGFHMSDVIQIDFNGPLNEIQAEEVEQKVNAYIYKNVPILTDYPSKSELEQIEYRSKKELKGQVRIITIPEVDVCACCGTHVKATGEIGVCKVLSVKKHKQGVRLELVFGRRAMEYFEKLHAENEKISRMLSAPSLETASYVQELLTRNEALLKQIQTIRTQQFLKECEDLHQGSAYVYVSEGSTREQMRYFAKELLKKMDMALILQQEEHGTAYVLMSLTKDVRETDALLKKTLQGKGGGSKELVQGSFTNSLEEILKVWKGMGL